MERHMTRNQEKNKSNTEWAARDTVGLALMPYLYEGKRFMIHCRMHKQLLETLHDPL